MLYHFKDMYLYVFFYQVKMLMLYIDQTTNVIIAVLKNEIYNE